MANTPFKMKGFSGFGNSPLRDEKSKSKVTKKRRSDVESSIGGSVTEGDAVRTLRHDPTGKGEQFRQEYVNKQQQEKMDKEIAKKQKRYLKKKEIEKKRKENLRKLKEQRERRAKEGRLPF